MQQVSTLPVSTNVFSPAFPNFSLPKHFCRCPHSHLHLLQHELPLVLFAHLFFFIFFIFNYHKISLPLLHKVDFLFGHTPKKGLSTFLTQSSPLGIIHISCTKSSFFLNWNIILGNHIRFTCEKHPKLLCRQK